MSKDVDKDEIRTLDQLIENFQVAMLVTESLQGELRSRPMMIAGHQPGGALMFVTRAEDEKLQEVLRAPRVAVTMQSEDRYISISGSARLQTDQVLLDELWSPSWKIWFPEGSDDPELCLIRVEPSAVEYWDRAGANKLEFFWRAGTALLTGEKAADDKLSGHAKIELDDGESSG